MVTIDNLVVQIHTYPNARWCLVHTPTSETDVKVDVSVGSTPALAIESNK
jgi:hypothetical protein